MNKPLRWIFSLAWLLSLLMAAIPARAQDGGPLVLVLSADGPVSTVLTDYIERGIAQAGRLGARAIILELDTPDGAVDITTTIVQQIRNSPIPVIVYVSPRGAIAGSAGTLITLAGHVAAMAPETAIGAASPISLTGEEIDPTSVQKTKEILRATVRSLAENRPPEAVALAEETIESAVAVSSNEALAVGLIDIVASDLSGLLSQADGRTVLLTTGQQTLDFPPGTQIERMEPSLIEQLLLIMTNPNIVFLLLAVGVQAILIELSSPGGWVAGAIGVVALALAIYGLGLLPVNWFGLIFLILAFALFFLELKTPSNGPLTAAGVAAFVAGALILFNGVESLPDVPRLSVPLAVAMGLVTGGTFFGGVMLALRAQRNPIQTGMEAVTGRTGTVAMPFEPRGQVQIGGEMWTAELAEGQPPLEVGARVRVESVQGLRVIVRAAGEPAAVEAPPA